MLGNTFLEQCLNGDVLIDDVDEFVSKWHSIKDDIPIEDYLGMTKKEYNAWLLDDSMLPYILRAHKEEKDLEDVYSQEEMKVAARSANAVQVAQLFSWLKENG